MIYLILSILFSVALLINFRLFSKYDINTFQAIVFNYPVCFITGYFLMDQGEKFQLDFHQNWTWYCLALGVGFIITFILSGVSTQRIGMTVTSLANNISLVIPVLFSLLVFGSNGVDFKAINYFGLILGILAVCLAAYRKEEASVSAGFWERGGLALSVFLMYGITNTVINYVQINIIKDGTGVIPVMLIMILGAIVSGLTVLAYKFITGNEVFQYKNLVAAVTLGIPNFLSFYFLIKALNHFGSSGALVYPLYNMGVILLSAAVGLIVFKEMLTKINKIGLALAVIAILFISWDALFI
jgi:drug/metabolite transporter (DMT)-like permease